jgi:hypothetical protein
VFELSAPFGVLISSSCPNAKDNTKANRGIVYTKKWAETYLKDAQARLAPQIKGYDLTIEDMFTLQQMCAYEVSPCPKLYTEMFLDQAWNRPLPSGSQNSARSSRKTNGQVSIMRADASVLCLSSEMS